MTGMKIPRRDFFRKASAFVGTSAAFVFGEKAQPATPKIMAGSMPAGRLGNLEVSRLIGGHNLVGFPALAGEDLLADQLLQTPVAEEKILEIFASYEKAGINTAFLRVTAPMVKVARRYGTERGGKLQWIAQLVVDERNPARGIDIAMQLGVHAAYIRGMEGDRYAPRQMDVLAKGVAVAKSCKIPIGLGGHNLETIMAAEAAGLPIDFYVKTFNNAKTSMSGENTLGETAEFFARVEKPWIAFRVVGPARMSARDGFRYAFADGADFVSAGMFDFWIAEEARLVRELFAGKLARPRPWRA